MIQSTQRQIAIVQRGRTDAFEELQKRDFAEVIWDRRFQERRKAAWPVLAEWRRGDRRQATPDTWTRLGYILVPARYDSAQ